MSLRDLIPWARQNRVPLKSEEEAPFPSLQKEIERTFEEFGRGWGLTPLENLSESLNSFSPGINVADREKEVEVRAELPGMDEKDIEISIANNRLTIEGEKKDEKEDQREGYYHRECSWGAFQRSVDLPEGIDEEKVSASFSKGVLTIILPKSEEARDKVKRISISKE